MRMRSRVLLLTVAFVLIIAALVFPIGPLGCGGLDCFTVGPFSRTTGTGNSARTNTTAIQIVFPGTAYYSDGTTQTISSQQSAFAIFGGPSNKQISKIVLGVRLQISTTSNLVIGLSGYYDEVASRPTVSPIGAYYRQISHTPIATSYTLKPTNSTTFYLANVSHTADELSSFSDIGGPATSTSSSYNYALVGFLNFTISQPIGKVVNVMLAWPSYPISVSAPGAPPPPPGGGGYPRCTRYICAVSVIGPPQGVRFSWYVLGTAVPLQFTGTAFDSQSILAELGLI